jgi:hypothetical protein
MEFKLKFYVLSDLHLKVYSRIRSSLLLSRICNSWDMRHFRLIVAQIELKIWQILGLSPVCQWFFRREGGDFARSEKHFRRTALQTDGDGDGC